MFTEHRLHVKRAVMLTSSFYVEKTWDGRIIISISTNEEKGSEEKHYSVIML